MPNKILVVEDERTILLGIKEVLERAGYQVKIAENGQQALDIMESASEIPDLIVSDIMMPVMDGYEFIRTVRARQAWLEIPIIYLTAKTKRADINEGRRMGVDDYLVKPFVPEELLLAVNAKLQRKREIQDYHNVAFNDLRANIMTILNHELRTPLTYIVGFNDLLQINPEDITSSELQLILPKIDKGAQRLRRLIENFILLVDLQTDHETMRVTLSNLLENYAYILHSCLVNYEEIAAETNISFNVQIAPDAPPIISDQHYILKIVDSLLDNAFKFTPKEGSVSLVVQPYHDRNGEPYLYIEVADNGSGIAEAHIPHIFEPFYQAIRHDDEHPGTGSGLAIVKGLVELHGGEVHVETQSGIGSTFAVYLRGA